MALQDIREQKMDLKIIHLSQTELGVIEIRYILLSKCVWRLTDRCQAIAILVPHLEHEASMS